MSEPIHSGPDAAPSPEPGGVPLAVAGLWIWTVLFGLNGGLSYSFLSEIHGLSPLAMLATYQVPGGRFGGPIAGSGFIILPIAYAGGLLASIASWLFLYLYFASFILPVVILGVRGPHENRRRQLAAAYLNRTYQLLIVAGLARATPELVYLFLPALTGLGLR